MISSGNIGLDEILSPTLKARLQLPDKFLVRYTDPEVCPHARHVLSPGPFFVAIVLVRCPAVYLPWGRGGVPLRMHRLFANRQLQVIEVPGGRPLVCSASIS